MGKVKEAKDFAQKYKTLILIGVLSLTIAQAAVSMYYTITAYMDFDDNIDDFSEILTNWKLKAIKRFFLTTGDCADSDVGVGSEIAPYTWPGTYAGCFCGDVATKKWSSLGISSRVFVGTCSTDQTSAGCTNVAAQEAVKLNKLAYLSGTGYKLCAIRGSDSFYSVASVSLASGCPSDYLTCGSGQNIFCTQDPSCPITKITSSEVTTSDTDYTTTCTGLSNADCLIVSVHNTDARIIYFQTSDDFNGMPITEIALNEWAMCDSTSDENITPGRTEYPLLKRQRTNCGDGSIQWGSETVEDAPFVVPEDYLFDMNSVPYGQLTEYYGDTAGVDGGDFKWGLFMRAYVRWLPSCRGYVVGVSEKAEFIYSLANIQLGLMIVAIVSGVILSIVIPVFEIKIYRGGDFMLFKGEAGIKKAKAVQKTIATIFKVAKLPLMILCVYYTSVSKDYFSDLSDSECSLDYVNTILSTLSTNVETVYSSNLQNVIICGVLLLLDFALMLGHALKERKKRKMVIVQSPKDSYRQQDHAPPVLNNDLELKSFAVIDEKKHNENPEINA